MTTVLIPPADDGSGNTVSATVRIRLVNARGLPRVGWHITNRSFQITEREIALADAPVPVELVPQAEIAIDAAGSPSYYEFTIRPGTWARADVYLAQVPVSLDPVHLMDLVGASAIDPGDVLAGRLLPDFSGEPDGSVLGMSSGFPAWMAPAEAGSNIDGGQFT